jgi:hypothetical protein
MIDSRNLNYSDINSINNCIDQHSKMYGVPFSQQEMKERMKHILDSDNHVIGAFEENKLIGICTQLFWKNFPFWSFSNMFVESPPNLMFNTKVTKVLGALLNQSIINAERLERFEFFYLYRDNPAFQRKKQTFDIILNSNPEVAQRYDYQTLHKISKPEDVKWKYVEWFLGDIGLKAISAPHNKTLYLRRAVIKQEFRKI